MIRWVVYGALACLICVAGCVYGYEGLVRILRR
jgi:hypothetical protein